MAIIQAVRGSRQQSELNQSCMIAVARYRIAFIRAVWEHNRDWNPTPYGVYPLPQVQSTDMLTNQSAGR